MAGYVVVLGDEASLRACVEKGVYGTVLRSVPDGWWATPYEATFGDYVTMSQGDNIYFFIQRMLYGVGRLVSVVGDCKHLNFPDASEPKPWTYQQVKPQLLWDEGVQSVQQRWLCTFEPDPHFFVRGVDMDDVLASNPAAFRMLRVMERRSFIKVDDDENQALRDVILKANQDAMAAPSPGGNVHQDNHGQAHATIAGRHSTGNSFDAGTLMDACASGTSLGHEMALEVGLLHQLSAGDPHATQILGDWDYLSHQVVASPFKPPRWVDWMDVFGYSYVPNYRPTVARYLAGEVKKGDAIPDDVEQVMKYVDWVKDEYAHGDYSMIHSFLVARSFPTVVVQRRDDVGRRIFTVRRRPAVTQEWKELKLLEYQYNLATRKLQFKVV
jgi:hypothetical protein